MATNVAVVTPAAEGYVTSVAADGTVNIFNSGAAPLDFVIDVNGYFK